MPFETDNLDFKAGDPLLAAHLQAIVGELRRPSNSIRGGPGVFARRGARGEVQVAGTTTTCFVGKANGNISKRVGTAWGTGTVTRLSFDGTNDSSTGYDYAVVNPSATTMTSGNGIDSGQYCLVQEDSDGNFIVTPLECS